MATPAIHMDISDAEQLVSFLETLPSKVAKKPLVAILRKGANEVKKELRRELPSNMKKFKAIIGAKATRGFNTGLTVGFYGRKVYFEIRQRTKWDSYFLVYWANYGTLSNRDASHKFKKGRRAVSSSWKGGIKAGGFVERGMERGTPKAEQKIEQEFYNVVDAWASKHGFR